MNDKKEEFLTDCKIRVFVPVAAAIILTLAVGESMDGSSKEHKIESNLQGIIPNPE